MQEALATSALKAAFPKMTSPYAEPVPFPAAPAPLPPPTALPAYPVTISLGNQVGVLSAGPAALPAPHT